MVDMRGKLYIILCHFLILKNPFVALSEACVQFLDKTLMSMGYWYLYQLGYFVQKRFVFEF